jgi:REP element-mobilizing transposase RayT
MEKYQHTYRVPSARLNNWDYASNASYFITICTRNGKHYFGEIKNVVTETQCTASLHATEIGNIVEQEWILTPTLRPDMNLELGAFVVMPNHFHGILVIGENTYNTHRDSIPTAANRKDTIHAVSAATGKPTPQNQFGPQSMNVASIIRGFKASVTTRVRLIGNSDFAWQPRFYDKIIRDHTSYERIRCYILNNPANWVNDKFHSSRYTNRNNGEKRSLVTPCSPFGNTYAESEQTPHI